MAMTQTRLDSLRWCTLALMIILLTLFVVLTSNRQFEPVRLEAAQQSLAPFVDLDQTFQVLPFDRPIALLPPTRRLPANDPNFAEPSAKSELDLVRFQQRQAMIEHGIKLPDRVLLNTDGSLSLGVIVPTQTIGNALKVAQNEGRFLGYQFLIVMPGSIDHDHTSPAAAHSKRVNLDIAQIIHDNIVSLGFDPSKISIGFDPVETDHWWLGVRQGAMP